MGGGGEGDRTGHTRRSLEESERNEMRQEKSETLLLYKTIAYHFVDIVKYYKL